MRKALLGLLLIATLPGVAMAEMGFYGWGFRLGIGDDPDQVIVGFQQDFGEIVERLRLQPNLELGFGDDYTIISGTLPVHFRFGTGSSATPNLGAGVQVAWVDRDKGRGGSEVEIEPDILGGVEWPLRGGSDLFLELHLGGSDVHDAKLILGWMFRAR